MALKDYEFENEDEFYGQGFEKEGVISVWIGLSDDSEDPEGLDVLQDLCGVGYYELDQQEGNCFNFELVPIHDLLAELSYSKSYIDEATSRAKHLGITEARWVMVQYDFNYDPKKVTRSCAPEPVFIGVFEYETEAGL